MLLFINFRYMKHFETYKQKQLQQLKAFASVVSHGSSKAGGTDKASTTHHKTEKSVKFAETEYDGGEGLN